MASVGKLTVQIGFNFCETSERMVEQIALLLAMVPEGQQVEAADVVEEIGELLKESTRVWTDHD